MKQCNDLNTKTLDDIDYISSFASCHEMSEIVKISLLRKNLDNLGLWTLTNIVKIPKK